MTYSPDDLEFKAEPTPAEAMTTADAIDPLDASLDIVALAEEQDKQGGAIKALRSDVDSLKGQMTRISTAAARPALDGTKAAARSPQAAAFVERYLRRGDQQGLELKSFSGASLSDGGYAVPREIDALIGRTLKDISPIRAIANVVQTGSAGYRKLVTSGGAESGWVSETADRLETDTPTFHEIAPPTGDLYANPAASQAMLDDAAFDVEAWLADEIAREFAAAEGTAFVSGSGTNQPKGFLTGTPTDEDDAVRAFGTLQYVPTGADGAFTDEDDLIDLVHSLRPAYRQGASFVMNSATLAVIRKMKTTDGQFLWQPSMAAGQPATLLGYPVVEAQDMPDIDSDSLSVAFGNFREGYLIAERSATGILRDPFTNKPFVHFYATKRVGGQVMNSEAIKLLKFATS